MRQSFIGIQKSLFQWGSIQANIDVVAAGVGAPKTLSLSKLAVLAARVTLAGFWRNATEIL